MEKINAKGISQIAKERLNERQALTIHSRFDQSLNLLSGTKLIYIGERALPFGIKIDNFEDLKNMQDVMYTKDKLIFTTKQGIKKYILIDALSVIDDRHEAHLYHLKEKKEFLKALVDTKALKPLHNYIGRGIGLTPSGDDFLVGLYSVSFCDANVYKIMNELKNTNFKGLTTSVSAEYLDAARKGHFNPDLIKLLASKTEKEFKETVRNILRIGHSSGRDTLEGVLQGLDIIDKEHKNEKENCSRTGW